MTTTNPGDVPEQPDASSPQTMIGLGSNNQFGDVKIDTVAGRDAITINVHLPTPEDKTVANRAEVKHPPRGIAQPTIQVGPIFKLSVHPVIAEICSVPIIAWIGSTVLGFIIWVGTVNLIKVDNAYTTFLGILLTVSLQWLSLRGKIPFAWSWIVLQALLWAGAILWQADKHFFDTYLVPYLLFGGPIFMLTNGRFVKVGSPS